MRAQVLGVIAAVAAIAVTAAEPTPAPSEKRYSNTTAIVDVVAGENHVNGEARWTSVNFGNLSATCWLTGQERAKALGKQAGMARRDDFLDCWGHSAWIHNTSDRALSCRAQLTMPEPDDSGRTKIVESLVLLPDSMFKVATAFTREANRPIGHATKCDLASEKEIPQPFPASCRPKLTKAADPDAFYPDGLKAKEVLAAVLINGRVDRGSDRLHDIFVEESSGYRELDIGALKVATLSVMAVQDCDSRRFRFRVKFKPPAEKPPAPETLAPSPPT